MVASERMEALGGFAFRWRGILVPALLLVPALALGTTVHDSLPGLGRSSGWSCAALGLLGFAMRGLTVGFVRRGSSGRNTRGQKAAALNVRGTYSMLRNPLYVANTLMVGGVILVLGSWIIFAVSMAGILALYGSIVRVEEAFLADRFGEAYRAYARRTPRFVPRPWLWRKPDSPWSWRMLVRREHDAAFALLVGLAAARTYRVALLGGRLWDPGWALALAAGLLVWLVVKFLKKRT
ncbi:MAG: isoprenylcysteine carboxylmethyltransferase family protein, partial [Planctomycetota bacterium]